MKQYYYHDGEQNQGPFTLEELAGVNLDTETFVWHAGLENWLKAVEVPEVAEMIAQKALEEQKATPPPAANYTVEEHFANSENTTTQKTNKILGFSEIAKLLFKDPLSALRAVFINPAFNNFKNTIVLYSITIMMFLVVGILMEGVRGVIYVFIPLFGMLSISLLSFLVKSVFADIRPNLKAELFTGALCALPYVVLLILYLLLNLMMPLLGGGFGGVYLNPTISLIFALILAILQAFIISQSLSASIARKALAWVMAVFIVLISFLITNKIFTAVDRILYYY